MIVDRQRLLRAVRAPLAVALLGVLLVSCGGGDNASGDDPGPPQRVTIDVARKVGTKARARAEGIVKRPAAVAVRVSSAPRQRVLVAWGLSCPKTKNATAKATGGTYVTTTPNVRALQLPRRDIAFCAVYSEARLTGRGRVKVTLIGSER